MIRECKKRSYKETVVDNIKKLHGTIANNQVFGTSDIEEIIKCSKTTAYEIMKRLIDMDVVLPVKGKGKGKYRFKYETEI